MRTPTREQLAALLRWPPGLVLVTWRYLWRTTPLHRREEVGTARDLAPPLPEDMMDEAVQQADDGVGPLFHRTFSVEIVEPRLGAEELMSAVCADPNQAAPNEVARFHREGGDAPVARGEEMLVHMPGPWNGPVRVVARTPTSLRLLTRRGHLEAGQIEFRATQRGDDVVFTVESWAKAGDRFADLLYRRLRLAKEIQFNMWVHFCLRAVAIAGGRARDGITIVTRRVDVSDLPEAA